MRKLILTALILINTPQAFAISDDAYFLDSHAQSRANQQILNENTALMQSSNDAWNAREHSWDRLK